MKNSKQIIFGTVSVLLLAFMLLNLLVSSGRSHTVRAGNEVLGFLPLILGDKPILPPATMVPKATSTGTPTATVTNTPQPTLTPTPTNTPFPAPVIEKFEASPSVILSGQNVRLRWVITGDFDSVEILPDVGGVSKEQTEVVVSPSETTNYELIVTYNVDETVKRTVTVTIGEAGEEIVVFNLNREVLQGDFGFPGGSPSGDANGDWTQPPNYADGSLFLRWQIRNHPAALDMILHFCMWQPLDNDPFKRETCTDFQNVAGTTGTIVQTNQTIFSMWRNYSIAWDEQRHRYAMVVRDKEGCPITSYNVPESSLPPACPVEDGVLVDWAGYNPELWYPLDLCFTVIAVGKERAFSGWENYTYLCN